MRKRLNKLVARVGQRGVLLLVFAITSLAYGAGLLLGYHPTFNHALDIDVRYFGLMFVATGLVCLIGALNRWGRFPYSFAVTTTTFWICLLFTFWSYHRGFAWVAIMPWVMIDLTQLLAAIWPEPETQPIQIPIPSKVQAYASDDTDPSIPIFIERNDHADDPDER